MNATTKKGIEESLVYVSIIPEGGLEGTEGEAHLLYAISLGKPIIIWRPEPAEQRPFPEILKGRTDVTDVIGDESACLEAITVVVELKKEGSIRLIEGPYDGGKKDTETH